MFINAKEDGSFKSRGIHLLLWLPRWIVATSMIPVWLGESVGVGILVFVVSSNTVASILLAIGAFVVSIIGIIYTQKSSILKEIAPKMKA